MPRIRTTLEPDQEIEVGDVELNDLQRLGLVRDIVPAPTARPVKAAEEKAK